MPQPMLYSEMVTYLEAMITSGVYAPGDKLPVQRELCDKFSLTQGTVGRGLAVLEKRGLIRQRRGAGAFVCHTKQKNETKTTQVGILIEEYDGDRTYCGHILRGVQALAAERKCGLNLNFTAYTDFDADRLKEYAENFDGILLIGVYDTTASQLPRTRPCVGVNMYRAYGFASTIDLDPIAAAELASERFLEQNVKRVICYSINPNGTPPSERINNIFKFRARMFRATWPGECIICDSDEKHDIPPEEWLNDDSTGLLFVSGSHYETVARAYQERIGRPLTADAPVVSIDGKSLLVPEYLPVDTVSTDYFAMGQMALDECLRRIQTPGAGPRRMYQHVYLTNKNRNLQPDAGAGVFRPTNQTEVKK